MAFPVLLMIFSPIAVAAKGEAPLFSDERLIEATIEAPFSRIMRDRSQKDELPGTFSYTDSAGLRTQFDIKLRVRGKNRAKKDVCKFAPLRLNFQKKQVSGTEFDGQDKLKLVTHCSREGVYEQFILKEYLNYKIFEEFTQYAFRTRLLRITYVDSDGKKRPITKYAFLIEHQEQLAKRLGAIVTKIERIKSERLDPAPTNLVTVFSYFIGNTDYSPIRGAKEQPCCHNVILLRLDNGLFLPIPYDFDLSGMVSASYATPNPKYKLRSVSDRLYLGWCRNNELLVDTFEAFHDKREDISALINNQDGLTGTSRRYMDHYIDRFFKTLAKDSRVKRAFIKKCS